jgi:N-acetylglucosaminyldiphosphoundecaprenol N-acetyl-beta-D-mannosaminyltransferase
MITPSGSLCDTMKNKLAKTVIGAPVTALPFDAQTDLICEWAKQKLSRFVCVANVHMTVEAHWHPEFASVLKQADLVTPDGMPLVWMLKLLGAKAQNRVAGMDLLLSLCESASESNIPVFFVGSQRQILDRMRTRLTANFPNLQIAGMEPLPFRPLTEHEQDDMLQTIEDSGAGMVFVSLGCPKQEYWMSKVSGRVNAVMLGVGGVFPVYAGIQKHAPKWVREMGMEWFYRLVQEPRRLWKRYLTTNVTFIRLALIQLAGYYATGVLKQLKFPLGEGSECSKAQQHI